MINIKYHFNRFCKFNCNHHIFLQFHRKTRMDIQKYINFLNINLHNYRMITNRHIHHIIILLIVNIPLKDILNKKLSYNQENIHILNNSHHNLDNFLFQDLKTFRLCKNLHKHLNIKTGHICRMYIDSSEKCMLSNYNHNMCTCHLS